MEQVIINGVRLDEEELRRFQAEHGLQIPAGEYWYDRISGAWGRPGGPALGFTRADLELGGPLHEEASNGDPDVLVNGRRLHPAELQSLNQLVPVLPGRYRLDPEGWAGYENGPPMVNLFQLAQQAGGQGGGPAWVQADADGHPAPDGGPAYLFDPQAGSSAT